MISSVENAQSHVELDPSELFWSVIDAHSARAALRAAGRSKHTNALAHLFDDSLPIPVEDVHAVYKRTPSGAVVVCALPVSQLSRYLEDGALTLSPSRLPEWIEVQVDVTSMNLLTAQYEPAVVKRARRDWQLHTAGLLLALLTIAIIGLESRRALWQSKLASIKDAEHQLYKQVLPPGPSSQPDALRLTAELRRLRQTRTGPEYSALPPRADDRLALLLASWPGTQETRAELITITPEGIFCRVVVPDAVAAADLADALSAIPGWRAEQPQIRSQRDAVRTTIRLEPVAVPEAAP